MSGQAASGMPLPNLATLRHTPRHGNPAVCASTGPVRRSSSIMIGPFIHIHPGRSALHVFLPGLGEVAGGANQQHACSRTIAHAAGCGTDSSPRRHRQLSSFHIKNFKRKARKKKQPVGVHDTMQWDIGKVSWPCCPSPSATHNGLQDKKPAPCCLGAAV